MRARITIFFIVIILGFMIFRFAFFSNTTEYTNFHTINNSEWLLSDTATFYFSNRNTNLNNHNIVFYGKINQEYSYANLYLFVDVYLEKMRIKRDTLNCVLYDSFGKPKQKNIGNTQFFSIDYVNKFKFETGKDYKFQIIHGMRDLNLSGVEKIGIKINKH